MELHYTIIGNPVTKKNHPILIGGSRPRLVPSAQYQKYEKEALNQLNHQGDTICEKVQIICKYYMKTKRKVDLTNLMEATDDILVKAGIIEDDNCDIIYSHDGSRVLYDPDNPRAEIIIRDKETAERTAESMWLF